MRVYVTYGPVRGWCGHYHRTYAAAERCLERDRRGCRRQGGYSDRSVYVVDRRRPWRIDGTPIEEA